MPSEASSEQKHDQEPWWEDLDRRQSQYWRSCLYFVGFLLGGGLIIALVDAAVDGNPIRLHPALGFVLFAAAALSMLSVLGLNWYRFSRLTGFKCPRCGGLFNFHWLKGSWPGSVCKHCGLTKGEQVSAP